MSDAFRASWALVTGASLGLGEEMACQLAAYGANLVLTARSRDRLESLAGALAAEHGVETRCVPCDLAAPGGARQLCARVEALGVEIDHLVSNAGFGTVGPFAQSRGDEQADMVRLNCEAAVVLAGHFLPRMVQRGRGGILHVASVAGYVPMPYMATYAATKAFLLSFSAALSEETRGTGVTVTALCPGPVRTGFQARAGGDLLPEDERAELSAEATVRAGIEAYAAGRDRVVPGLVNRVNALGSRILPTRVVTREVARRLSPERKAGLEDRSASSGDSS